MSQFFNERLWADMIAGNLVLLIRFLTTVSSYGYPFFTGPRSFPEISGLPTAEQRRLLREACAEVPSRWHLLGASAVYINISNLGFLVGHYLARSIPVLGSVGSSGLILSLLFVFPGGWAAEWLREKRLRPSLQRILSRRLGQADDTCDPDLQPKKIE